MPHFDEDISHKAWKFTWTQSLDPTVYDTLYRCILTPTTLVTVCKCTAP